MSGTTRPVYCPYRGGLKLECETPNACAGGADCRRGADPEHQRVSHQTTLCETAWRAYQERLGNLTQREEDMAERAFKHGWHAAFQHKLSELMNG